MYQSSLRKHFRLSHNDQYKKTLEAQNRGINDSQDDMDFEEQKEVGIKEPGTSGGLQQKDKGIANVNKDALQISPKLAHNNGQNFAPSKLEDLRGSEPKKSHLPSNLDSILSGLRSQRPSDLHQSLITANELGYAELPGKRPRLSGPDASSLVLQQSSNLLKKNKLLFPLMEDSAVVSRQDLQLQSLSMISRQ